MVRGGGGGGGSHEIFTNRKGDQQFFCGGINNLIESFISFLPAPPPPSPCELKNDNSLSLKRCINFQYDKSYELKFLKHFLMDFDSLPRSTSGFLSDILVRE